MKTTKKILSLIAASLFAVMLFGCKDKKTSNEKLTVIFFTGADSASVVTSKIEPLLDFTKGELIEEPAAPTAAGLQFEGWYKEKTTVTPWHFDTDTVEKSTVLYAKWTYLDLAITYIFDDAGGEFIDPPVLKYTIKTASIMPKADRLGSLFIGWILTPVEDYKVGNPIVKSTQGFSTDITLYALFENKEYTVRFRSMLDGVPNPTIYTVKFASDIAFPVLSDTTTKRFLGWFSLDGSQSGDWGFQYINGELFRGKATSYDEVNDEWTFIPQGITVYGKWANK